MASHSSTLAQKISWTEEPGGLQSMGLLSRTRLSDFTFTFHFHALEKEIATHSSILAWRILWGSLVGCHLWGHTEADTTEATQQQQQVIDQLFNKYTRYYLECHCVALLLSPLLRIDPPQALASCLFPQDEIICGKEGGKGHLTVPWWDPSLFPFPSPL